MITRDVLDNLAKKLMFKMNDEEYKTLENEFDVILKQMEFIDKIDGIEEVTPMTFPFELIKMKLILMIWLLMLKIMMTIG